MTAEARPRLRRTTGSRLRQFIGSIFNGIVSMLDLFFTWLQSKLGVKRMPYVFVLPNLLIFGVFILLPMLLNFVYAFTGGIEFFPGSRPWVGTANFEQLLTCQSIFDPNSCREDLFWRAVYNTLSYVAAQVSLMVFFSLITALALNRKIKGRAFFRSVFFYPVLLSPIVVALIWKWILQENGLLNAIVTDLGGDKVPFMVDAVWARYWVVMISVWAYMGFYTLILLAGLQAIPADIYEAADIDGANKWQSFWEITLPLLMPNMLVVVVLSLIRAVQVFDLVFAFTGGGPGSATQFLVQFIYDNGFSSAVKRYGIAASASLLMGVALVVLTLFQLRLNRQKD